MTIIGFCNPLLDITLNNHPEIPDLLRKYPKIILGTLFDIYRFKLKDNDIILAEGHDELVDQIIELGVEYSAGGAGLNSIRCAQSILKPKTCRIVGSIGQDQFGLILKEKSEESNVLINFQASSSKPTGKCACLIHGQFRSLVAYLGAANDFSPDHIDTIKTEIIQADYLYITGFFHSVSPESVKKIISYKSPNTKLIFNLSATFAVDTIDSDNFDLIMKSCYMLIGNSDEFRHLRRRLGQESSKVHEFYTKLSTKYSNCTVLVTQGSNPIELIFNGSVTSIPVPRIPNDLIVDTNGAGDAFAGGILASLHENKTIEESIKIGCSMASFVIKQSGIQPPPYSLQEILW